jgi:hypothetical protein
LRRLVGLFVGRAINAFPMKPLERLHDVHLLGTNIASITSQGGTEWT